MATIVRRLAPSVPLLLMLASSLIARQAQAEGEFDWSPPALAAAGKNYSNWDSLTSEQTRQQAYHYYAFVTGVMHPVKQLCASSVQGAQIATMVAKYLNDRPERWQLPPTLQAN